MKLLVEIITSQIEQITVPALKNWLLGHLNLDANNVSELFCKQIPAQLNQTTAPLPSNLNFPRHLAIFPILYAFAPDLLRLQLIEQLQQFPQLNDEVEQDNKKDTSNCLLDELSEIKNAWPIIATLRRQGANELIQVLDKADEGSLIALDRLNSDKNFSALLHLFLIKNSKDLEAINRHQIIPFLRQPDFSGWFIRYLDSFTNQATEIMSLRLLFLTFSSGIDEQDKVTELRACINTYPFSIHLDALWAVCHYYQLTLEQDLFSPSSVAFILLLHEVLQKMSMERQIKFLKGINQEQYLLIVDFCLKQCTVGQADEQQVYLDLLLLLCSETVVPNKNCLELIKTRLMQQDAYLFETPQIQELSKSIQAESNAGIVSGFMGRWIEQLISSPRFVAASSSRTLKCLIDRYAFHCATLNQVELSQLMCTSNEHGSDVDDWQNHLRRVNQRVLNQSEGQETWLVKQHQLLKAGIEIRTNKLLQRMETRCTQQNHPDIQFGKQALQVLYTYYNQTFSDLRFDLLVRAIDVSYQQADLNDASVNSQSGVLQRFKLAFPQTSEAEIELQRKQEVVLYNSAGQHIGFVHESNKAITYVEDEPVLLSRTHAVRNEEPVYDGSGRVVGYLTGSSQIKSAVSFQKALCPGLLAMVSEKELDHSPPGLDMIIRHVLFENSLDELYGYESVAASVVKQHWLERRISNTVLGLQKELDSAVLKSLTGHFSQEGVFSLLASIQHKENAIHLFHEIISHDQNREQWLSGIYTADIHQFWNRHQVVYCLAEYMARYYDKPWFAQGLSQFAYYGKKYKIDTLLSNALALLFNDSRKCTAGTARFNTMLGRLIGSESCAAIVLKDFLNDRSTMAVQQVKNSEIVQVTRYFHKKHLIAVIHQLNKTSYWEGAAQYKLLLHILDKQHATVFVMKGSLLAAKEEWSSNELNKLSRFINRHLAKNRILDSEWSIGHRILGELIFRSANAGLTSMFYSKKTFNESLARLSFTRNYLEKLVDKFWIPDSVKEQVRDEVPRLKAWFRDTISANKGLSESQILQDWRILVHQTWGEINIKKLPMICAYLLNYSGQKKPLVLLLQDYFNSFQNKTEYLYPVTRLLTQFPLRDVSFVIFDALETAILKNPHILDVAILRDMAQFYAKSMRNEEIHSPEAELSLLTYFGQNKHYALVREGCKELADACTDKALKRRLHRGVNEAEVEGGLYDSPRQFFFEFIKTLKRLWHYGIYAEENASKIVKFCDDETPGPVRKYAPDQVNIPAVNARTNSDSLGFDIKRKQLIGLLDAVKRSPVIKTFDVSPSKTKQTLFGCAALPVHEQVVAGKQDMITI
jgi:hypothetical protein